MAKVDEVYFIVCFGDLNIFSVFVFGHNNTNAYNLHYIHTHNNFGLIVSATTTVDIMTMILHGFAEHYSNISRNKRIILN